MASRPADIVNPSPSLRKRFGQHHLTRGEVCRPMVRFLAPAGERVLEIGSGGGALTRELLAAGARVFGVERDPAWAFELQGRLVAGGLRAELVIGDATRFPYHRLPRPTSVAGNLPYNVGTGILESLLGHGGTVPKAAVLLQREVAERLAAPVGSRPAGSFTVRLALEADVEVLGVVRPGAFRPPPKVDSAMLGIAFREPALPRDEIPRFERLVRAGFGQRRKMLKNALGAFLGKGLAADVVEAAGLSSSVRAEEVTLEGWLSLHRAVEALGPVR